MNPSLDLDNLMFKAYMASCKNISDVYRSELWLRIFQSDQQNMYSKPLPWIGIYIALASLFCVVAVVADLLHGLYNRKLWFPCKYFSLNAASLTVIAVAIKLPMDLTNLMPGDVDRTAKLGSLSFMCTMIGNLLPSLATMDAKELVSNMIALGILVVTLVVNVCIQINTRALSYAGDEDVFLLRFIETGEIPIGVYIKGQELIAAIYVVLLLMLLRIYVCSSFAILKSKEILESKYQATHQADLKDPQPGRLGTVEKLKQHVSNYWIMAETGSPQFMAACSATTSASGVICALSTALHIYILADNITSLRDYNTSYEWTMSVILVIQSIGVILGTLAPLSRCFAGFISFKLSRKWIWNHIKVFQVESYWIQKLSDWKKRSIPFSFGSRNGKIVIEKLKVLFLSICIGFQKTVVVACKMIAVIPLLFVICVSYCYRCWKWLIKTMFGVSGTVLVQNPEHLGKDRDLSRYVLQLQDDMEFAERTLKGISKSVKRVIQKAEKKQPNNLMVLLTEPRGYKGVINFDRHRVPSLLSALDLNCWSLPLVTLTTIVVYLPNIQKNMLDFLLSSVSEGFGYVTLVEESLNATDDQRSIQKVAKTLWLEVEVYHEWLGNKLPKPANTAGQVLQWLRDTSNLLTEQKEYTDIGVLDDDSKHRSTAASSMYRITETLMLSYHEDIDQVSQEELFAQLTSMIADILAACLTNLPQVIAMKCHAMEIEKREASVHAAAQLLGETTQIINTLQDSEDGLA